MLLATPEQKEAELLELFVRNTVHVGSRIKVAHMEPFIYRMRPDGVFLIDVRKAVERLNMAARMMSLFPPDKVVVVSTHVYGMKAVRKFCEVTGCVPIVGKMKAGLFTNRTLSGYMEPQLVLVSDPRYDVQAVEEAAIARIPLIAMCSTDNPCSKVDLVIPMNNRGRTSLPFAFMYLAKQLLAERGQLVPELEASLKLEDFTTEAIAVKAE